MAVTIPSGLGATIGFAQETTVGTFVAPSRWTQFEKETFQLKKKIAQSLALHQGLYEQTIRRQYVYHDVDGTVTMDLTDQQMGLFFKHALGSQQSFAQVGLTAAWLGTYQPADQTGLSLSIQVGRPMVPSGTVQSFSYNGCKITNWELSVARGQLAKATFTFDGWNEDTSQTYSAPTFVACNPMNFSQGAVLLGGTASLASGIASVAGGTAPAALISKAIVKGVNPLHQDRANIGTTTKKEQISNAFRKITGELELEFANLTDTYTSIFSTDTAIALQFNLTGTVAIGGGNFPFTKILIPNVLIEQSSPPVEGQNILLQKCTFTALDDGSTVPIQIQYQTKDVAS